MPWLCLGCALVVGWWVAAEVRHQQASSGCAAAGDEVVPMLFGLDSKMILNGLDSWGSKMSFLNFHQVKCLHARFLPSNEVMQWQENRRKPDVLYFKDIEWHYRILNRDHACVQSSLECRILSSYVELEGNRFVGILHRLSQLLCSRPRGVAPCGIPSSSNTMTINDYITHHYTIIHNELIQCKSV